MRSRPTHAGSAAWHSDSLIISYTAGQATQGNNKTNLRSTVIPSNLFHLINCKECNKFGFPLKKNLCIFILIGIIIRYNIFKYFGSVFVYFYFHFINKPSYSIIVSTLDFIMKRSSVTHDSVTIFWKKKLMTTNRIPWSVHLLDGITSSFINISTGWYQFTNTVNFIILLLHSLQQNKK